MQAEKLFDDEKQEEDSGPARIQEILQVLQDAYAAQGDQITGSIVQQASSSNG
jgi:hypothetical protein